MSIFWLYQVWKKKHSHANDIAVDTKRRSYSLEFSGTVCRSYFNFRQWDMRVLWVKLCTVVFVCRALVNVQTNVWSFASSVCIPFMVTDWCHELLVSVAAVSILGKVDGDNVQWCDLRPSVLEQDRAEAKKIGLGLGLAGLVLCYDETRSCQAHHHNYLEGYNNFSSTVCSFSIVVYSWNTTTVEINSGVHLLKS